MALILNQRRRTLTSDTYGFVKTIQCSLEKKWDELQVIDVIGQNSDDELADVTRERHRHCFSCQKKVFNLDGLSEEQIEAAIMANPKICIHATIPHPAILEDPASKRLVSDRISDKPNCPRVDEKYRGHGLREVKTARSLACLNQAVADGMRVLIIALEADENFVRDVNLVQYEDGTYTDDVDVRDILRKSNHQGKPITPHGFFSQYRYQFNNPWAAYILPSDIESGEQVFIWDIIEDRAGARSYLRQGQAIGTWTGDGFDIPVQEPVDWVG